MDEMVVIVGNILLEGQGGEDSEREDMVVSCTIEVSCTGVRTDSTGVCTD